MKHVNCQCWGFQKSGRHAGSQQTSKVQQSQRRKKAKKKTWAQLYNPTAGCLVANDRLLKEPCKNYLRKEGTKAGTSRQGWEGRGRRQKASKKTSRLCGSENKIIYVIMKRGRANQRTFLVLWSLFRSVRRIPASRAQKMQQTWKQIWSHTLKKFSIVSLFFVNHWIHVRRILLYQAANKPIQTRKVHKQEECVAKECTYNHVFTSPLTSCRRKVYHNDNNHIQDKSRTTKTPRATPPKNDE